MAASNSSSNSRANRSKASDDKAAEQTGPQADEPAEQQDAAPAPAPADTTAQPEDDDADKGLPDDESGHTYLNVTRGPVMYTERGHMAEANTWTLPVNLDAIGRAARDRGDLRSRTSLGLT